MKRTHIAVVAAIATLLWASQVALAEKIRVPEDHPTIQEAVDAANSGDTVVIGPGTYASFAIVSKPGITVKGKPGHEIRHADPFGAVFVEKSDDVRLLRLNVVGSLGIWISKSDGVSVRKCVVTDASTFGIGLWDSDFCDVRRCRVESVVGDGIAIGTDDLGSACYGTAVVRCEVKNCGGNGIAVYGELNDVAKNTVVDVGDTGIAMWSIEDPSEDYFNTVRRNSITDCKDVGIYLARNRHYAIKNVIKVTTNDGIHVESNGSVVVGNKVFDAGLNGLGINESIGSTYKKNKIYRSGSDGVEIRRECVGNKLIRNRAVDSGAYDLNRLGPKEDNTYANNVFPTVYEAPEEEEEGEGDS